MNFRLGSNPSHKDAFHMTEADSVHSTPPLNTPIDTTTAFVELNKSDCHYTARELEKIRKGVEAAQTLGQEMARAADQIIQPKQRRTNSEAMARNREFKGAMRRRIRDIAASRDLSDEDISLACETAKTLKKKGRRTVGWRRP